MITIFIILVCEVSKQLFYPLYGAIFQFYAENDLKVWRMRMVANMRIRTYFGIFDIILDHLRSF